MHAYDHGEPGWRAFERAFPGAGKGWQTCGATDSRYGAGWTATKMMSKIIREGIRRWGGTLVYEMKGVFGHNVFARNGWCGDQAQVTIELSAPGQIRHTTPAGLLDTLTYDGGPGYDYFMLTYDLDRPAGTALDLTILQRGSKRRT